MKKIVRNNKAKNEILEYLSKNIGKRVGAVSDELKIDLDLCFMCFSELEEEGYLTLLNGTTIDGRSFSGTVTEKGKVFIKDGGYPSSFVAISIKGIQNNINTTTSVIAMIISLFAYCNSSYSKQNTEQLLDLKNTQDKIINKVDSLHLEKQIDSLNNLKK